MEQQVIRDYVCTRDERMFWRYMVPFGLSIVAILDIALFIEAFRTKSGLGFFLFAFALLVFSIYLIVSYSKVRVIPHLAFCIEQGRISNCWPKGNSLELDLLASYFCTIFTCSFAYGTATTKKAYFLFSETPFNLNTINQNGFYALERINYNRVIIIPQTEATEVWVQQALKANRIPIYPAVVFKQGLFSESKIGDDSPS